MINRFIRAATRAAGRAGVDTAQLGSAVNRFMGRGDLVKSAPNPANPARTRNFATDAATGRHRSISAATADRYASYGKARAVGNAKRGAVGAATLGVAAAGMMGENPNPEAQAEERNPANERGGENRRRGGRRGSRGRNEPRRTRREERSGPQNGRGGRRGARPAAADAGSFDKAFAAARRAYKSGSSNATSFNFNGKSYSIVTKEDIAQAGAKDLRDFLNKGGRPRRD